AAPRLVAAVGLDHPREESAGVPGVEHRGDRMPEGFHEFLVASRHRELPLPVFEVGTKEEIPAHARGRRAQEIARGVEMTALAPAIEKMAVPDVIPPRHGDRPAGLVVRPYP